MTSGFLIDVTFINIINFCVWSVVDNEMVWRYYLLHLQVQALCLASQATLLTQVACHVQDRPALGSQTKRERNICGGSGKPSFVNYAFIFMNDVYLGYASRKGMALERALFFYKLF